MSQPIVECIPNFSEARRPAVIDSIRQAITSVPGVSVLDQHSDLDHNRTVITFAGAPQGVEEAAFRAIATAARLINLDEHSGAHPRIGATDVVPFVPISGVSMQECVEIARRLGRRVGGELDIPVYLYEEAASSPERQNLETHRRGQYEGLKAEIETHAERAPDFGPRRLGPAGATVIGARQPLIAYNIYLTTAGVSIAKKIAKAVRFSSGGLRYVKALGLAGGWARPSVHEPDQLPRHTPGTRGRACPARSRALRGGDPPQRAGGFDPGGCPGGCGRLVYAARPVRARADPGKTPEPGFEQRKKPRRLPPAS